MKYRFDIKSGHYIFLNEDDTVNVNTTADNNTAGTQTQQIIVQSIPTLNSPEVVAEQQKLQNDMKNFDTEIQRLKDQELQIQNIITTASSQFKATQSDDQKNNIRKTIVDNNNKLLDIKLKISNKEKDKAVSLNNHEQLIIQLQKKCNEALVPNNVIPEKYKSLNESNIQNAKIYLNNLVGNEDIYIIKGMTDFKRTLSKSELLYGKDKNGYFAICIDNEDFNKLYKAMGKVGYMRDRIIDAILPQVLDRGNMIQ